MEKHGDRMKNKIIIFCLILLVSCNEGNKKDYLIIDRIINNPESIDKIFGDSSLTSSDFKRNMMQMKEHKLWEKSLVKEIHHIREYFSDGYTIEKDIILPYSKQFTLRHLNKNRFVHLVTLVSKKDSNKILRFKFIDEENNQDWRLDFIGIVEAPS